MLTAAQEKLVKCIVCDGMNQKEAAKAVKVSEQTVCAWKKNKEFLEVYRDVLDKEMMCGAGRAYQKVIYLMDNATNEQVQLAAAKDILDRSGYKPKDNVSIEIPESKKLNDIIEQLGGEGLEE